MKTAYCLIIPFIVMMLFTQSPAATVELSETDFREAREFAALHKQNTGVVLNNTYSIGENKLFTERVIIRTKWHKLALLYMLKASGAELTDEEKKAVIGDKNLQIDVILFGHSIDFAQGYKAVISQNGVRLDPQKIHADHFESAQSTQDIYSGFPAYTATLRTYFNLAPLDISKPFTLTIIQDNHEKSFDVDLRNFR